MIVKLIDLAKKEGREDKVYHFAIDEVSPGLYTVPTAHGRRGSTLQRGDKCEAPGKKGTLTPVSLVEAEEICAKLIAEKIGKKNYRYLPGVSGVVFAGAISVIPGEAVIASFELPVMKKESGVLPQLLNDISESDIERVINDPLWGMQEKKNGERRLVRADGKGTVEFINRKGFVISESPRIAASIRGLDLQILPDGEQIGDTLYCFGLLELGEKNLRRETYDETFRLLEATLKGKTGNGLEIVPLARTAQEKRMLLEKVRNENGEGVVFKRLASVFVEGRPAAGGDQLKFKFVADGQFVNLGKNAGKRSIRLGALNEYGDVVEVGNCTIPSNHEIPEEGEIVAIQYLYAYRGGCLFQPVYLGKRADLERSDCTLDQLKFYDGTGANMAEMELASLER